jgi:hypothetical protein
MQSACMHAVRVCCRCSYEWSRKLHAWLLLCRLVSSIHGYAPLRTMGMCGAEGPVAYSAMDCRAQGVGLQLMPMCPWVVQAALIGLLLLEHPSARKE